MVHIVIPILPGTDSHMIKVKHANGLVRRQHRSNDVPAMRGDIVYTQDEVDLTRCCSGITCFWALFLGQQMLKCPWRIVILTKLKDCAQACGDNTGEMLGFIVALETIIYAYIMCSWSGNKPSQPVVLLAPSCFVSFCKSFHNFIWSILSE